LKVTYDQYRYLIHHPDPEATTLAMAEIHLSPGDGECVENPQSFLYIAGEGLSDRNSD